MADPDQGDTKEYSALEALPPEVLHDIIYGANVLSTQDILSLALTSMQMKSVIADDAYAVKRTKARLPLADLAARQEWGLILRALREGVRPPRSVLAAVWAAPLSEEDIGAWVGIVNEAVAMGAPYPPLTGRTTRKPHFQLRQWLVDVFNGKKRPNAAQRTALRSYRMAAEGGNRNKANSALLLFSAALDAGAKPSTVSVNRAIEAGRDSIIDRLVEVAPELFVANSDQFLEKAIDRRYKHAVSRMLSIPGFVTSEYEPDPVVLQELLDSAK